MKSLPWRSVVYLVVLLYLFLDLQTCKGPLHRRILSSRPFSEMTREQARDLGWVALVNRRPVTRRELWLAEDRFLYQRGRSRAEVSPSESLVIRRAVLRGLIDDILVEQYAEGEGFQADREEIDRFVRAWESQFPDEQAMARRMDRQGLTPEECRAELARIWTRRAWLESRIAPGVGVTAEEIGAWFEENAGKNGFLEPEKIRARQIFVSTVREDGEAQRKKIEEARKRLLDGEGFHRVAAELSEDFRTKDRGGELNWFGRDRVPSDFAEVVFAQSVGVVGEPFRSRIGWHIVEVLEHRPETPLVLADVEEEVRVYLENEQTRETLETFIGRLRKVASITVFLENLRD